MKKLSVQNISLVVMLLLSLSKFSFILPEFGSSKEENSTLTISDTIYSGFKNFVCAPPWEDGLDAPWNITKHLDSYKELNYNAAHMWISDCDSLGYWGNDTLKQSQRDRLVRIISDASQLGMTSVFERVNISNLCFSQRIIYEVGIGSGAQNRSTNYGFVFENNMSGVDEMHEGRTVLHPKTGINSANWLCNNIYENLQHSDLYYWYPGATDTMNFWHIKPVMRIDPIDFSLNDTTRVVAIVTKNFLGRTIDSNIIRVFNFADSVYTGDYVDNYFLLERPLQVRGRLEHDSSINYGREHDTIDLKEDCKVDFKVYWFGLVDVWFDKMIVDDERANRLFAGIYDKKIKNEVDLLHDKMVFFVDELVSSQAYTTKYVIDKMIDTKSDCKVEFSLSNNLNRHSHRNTRTRSKLLFDVIRPKIVCLDAHAFILDDYHELFRIYLPDNALDYDRLVPDNWKKSPSEYNLRLQTAGFGNKNDSVDPYQGTFIYQITKIRNDLRYYAPDAKFMVQPQLHSWTKTNTNSKMFEYGGFREPTNEEIQAEAGIAICHGVQSFNWVNYHSQNSTNINFLKRYASDSITYTNLGLRNDSNFSKRESNIIHQNKWNYVKAMNLKILHWKPTLDKVKWDSGYSVHYEGATHNFISDIKSIIVHSSPPTACEEDNINYDCQEERYWEMGFFVPDFGNPTVDQYDKSKYFMMVNRRCVPDTPSNGHGDLRQLKIKFDSTQLPGFRNWKIIEMDSNKVIRTFDKDSNIYIDMKIFQPGEGKLYKISPVMQEGGTLVANEQVEGITFTCNGPVNNNGKDISILEGTKINFKTGAGITMNGGKLTCSNYSTNTSENVLMKGYNGDQWNGIVMNSCMRSVIQRTRFEDAKNCIVISNGTGGSKYTAKIIRRNYFKVTADSGKALTINNQMEMAIDSNTFHRLCNL